ncbi:MAG: hypothetical protein IKE46_00895 [Selenomonadaceae bacterium]|nr:hypothetical protein [Selenomonadaceae bacterium]
MFDVVCYQNRVVRQSYRGNKNIVVLDFLSALAQVAINFCRKARRFIVKLKTLGVVTKSVENFYFLAIYVSIVTAHDLIIND